MRALVAVLVLAASSAACASPNVTASPTPGATSAAPRTSAPAATTAPPTATPSPTRTATPVTSPSAAAGCPTLTGRAGTAGGALDSVRAAHQPGFDRIVFDFGSGALPAYTLEPASSFIAPSGQNVPVRGNAHFSLRFQGAGQMGSYRGPTSLQPETPLVREVKVVEDFEGVLVWGIGLERLVCPAVLTLSGPTRLVVDFPTPP